MENKKEVSKKIIIISVVIAVLVLFVVVLAIYIQNKQPANIEEVNLEGGNVSLTYADDANLFVIEKSVPTSDINGVKLDSAELFFDFTVTTELIDAESIEYSVVLVKDQSISTSLNENIKVYLEKENDGTYSKVIEPTIFTVNAKDEDLTGDAMSIYNIEKTENSSDNYRLRMWLSDSSIFDSKDIQTFGVKVAIQATAK